MKAINFSAVVLIGGTSARALARDSICSAQSATEFAITYGEPLASYVQACAGPPNGPPINQLYKNTALATPQQTAIVSPNVDTLYMNQCYDISRRDIAITIPEVDSNRYYGVSFYTPEGDNYLNLGTLAHTKAGKYLLTPAVSSTTAGEIVAEPNSTYQGTIYAPRTLGYLLIRIVLKDQDGDVKAVNKIQQGFSTNTIERCGKPIGPELNSGLFANISHSKVENLLGLIARFHETVPLTNDKPLLPTKTTSELLLAGIGRNGSYQRPSCVNLAEAYKAANSSIGNYTRSLEFVKKLSNGWVMPRPSLIGTYGDNYKARVAVARFGYLALTNDQALYPVYLGEFALGTNESYTLRFAKKPPVTDVGFWSVTLYNLQKELVSNSINRYSLGDRSNLTFSDGTPVYGTSADVPFDILVQASEPPANWTSNWLPSPNTPGSFNMIRKPRALTR
ncbi:uncharacterized protein F4812DRAFT_304455 [Daldinia caldariorum]|uniref:uncharacterized protein n=1 Tax=Daldinia caldariorum TaxID=326644 RepID=UPI002008B0FA|nr:uncharacterized protein F4812DRAFT_304455 [Daldinia caldariorum]KAI1469825.1 hypothetical protein F4812DRAFT_304455 [Daldinia caldariorum]